MATLLNKGFILNVSDGSIVEYTMYTNASESNIITSNITLVNNSSDQDCTLNLFINYIGNKLRIAPKDLTIEGGDMVIIDTEYILEPGESISGIATTGNISFIINGTESI